jgi:hypothetical protein
MSKEGEDVAYITTLSLTSAQVGVGGQSHTPTGFQ